MITSTPSLRMSLPTAAIGVGVATLLALTVTFAGSAAAAEAPVGLGTADTYAGLAGSTVTNTGPSVIAGSIGVSPGTAITGFPPGVQTGGTMHAADAVADQAKQDLVTAYNDAAGRATSASVSADLAGQTLVAGVYTGPTLGLTGTVTLDAQGDPSSVFIFQASSTLITASSSTVALVNGASACNVYWQVGSSATLGTNSDFVGTVMALTSITANTGATIEGRLLARNGALTLDDNTITRPLCGTSTTTTTSSSSTSSSSTSPTSTATTTSPTSSSTSSTGTGGGSGTSGTSTWGSSSTHPAAIVHGAALTSSGNDTGSDSITGSLPFTGGNIGGPLALALAAMGTGAALLFVSRHRSHGAHR